MTLLQDIRGIFTKKKPVAVDLSSSQASTLTKPKSTTTKTSSGRVEPKPSATTSRRAEGPGASSSTDGNRELAPRGGKSGNPKIEEVVDMVRRISTHLESQTRRTDKLIECMERLPGALDALPEINRQNSHLLEIVGEYLDHARRRDDRLNDTLDGITSASTRQTEVLGLLQQQMDSNAQSTDALQSNLTSFKEAIAQLAGSNKQTTTMLANLNQSNERRENDLQKMLGRTQKWMIAAMVCCATASLMAIAVAGLAVFRTGAIGG